MEKFVIYGARPLAGRVRVDGSKNAVLPMLAAALLADTPTTLLEVPQLQDVVTMSRVLTALGADVRLEGGGRRLVVRPHGLNSFEAPAALVRKMRASFLVTGPLLARFGRVRIALPGGCAIGVRPIDLHLKAFKALGAEIRLGEGCIEVQARRLRGARIYLDYPSVGATEQVLMTACLAEGTTVVEDAAEEPEVVDLAACLRSMGARIQGAGTKVIRIEGVRSLQGARHATIPDRIEAGTYMVAAAMTGGEVFVDNVVPEHIKAISAKLKEMGAEITEYSTGVQVRARRGELRATDLKTQPYPGFPTDLQPQFMALLSVARGTSLLTETVFENRFLHVAELRRMGARIHLEERSAVIQGPADLSGAEVHATDLRAGAALVLAGLAARGRTEVWGVEHVDRGYVDLEGKLSRLGALISREPLRAEELARARPPEPVPEWLGRHVTLPAAVK